MVLFYTSQHLRGNYVTKRQSSFWPDYLVRRSARHLQCGNELQSEPRDLGLSTGCYIKGEERNYCVLMEECQMISPEKSD